MDVTRLDILNSEHRAKKEIPPLIMSIQVRCDMFMSSCAVSLPGVVLKAYIIISSHQGSCQSGQQVWKV